MTGISSDQLTPGAELPGADLSKRYWGAVNLDGAILANCDLSQSHPTAQTKGRRWAGRRQSALVTRLEKVTDQAPF